MCPHAGGVGLCELVQHLILFDYISVSASLNNRYSMCFEQILLFFMCTKINSSPETDVVIYTPSIYSCKSLYYFLLLSNIEICLYNKNQWVLGMLSFKRHHKITVNVVYKSM